MRVSFRIPCMVRPAHDPTWSGKMPLSELDQTGVTAHVPTIYFYTCPPDDWVTVLQTLKTSLSRILVHFYPLAGRLLPITGGRLELDCNAAGVQFTEAYADVKLTDMDSLLPSPTYYPQLIPSTDYHNSSLEETPLLVLQVTRFVCGGFSIGLSISHVVADGQSALHFVSEWARVSRGDSLESEPYLDRKALRAGDPPSNTGFRTFEHKEFDLPPILVGNENQHKEETTVTMLKLTATQVEKLRNKANESRTNEMTRGFTRYEAITAHVWRTACKARDHEPEQQTALAMSVDVRNKMSPPLPRKYFGNGIVNVIATGCSGEICSKPLGHVSRKIRDVIEMVNDEYVNSVIDFLKSQEDLSRYRPTTSTENGPFYGNPNVGVISWLTLPIYGADFGWGKEIHVGPGTHDSDGDSLILHGQEGDGSLIVALCLQVRHMENFKKMFYQDIDNE